MAVVKFLVEETGVTVTLDSITATAAYMVSELSGDPISREWQAVNHPEIPKPKDGHPAIPFIIVSNISAKHVDTSTVKVTVTWERKAQGGGGGGGTEEKGPANATLAVGSTTYTTSTQLDVEKKPLTVKYTDTNGNTDEQYGEVETTITDHTRTFNFEFTESWEDKSREFTNTVNSTPIWDGAEGTWKCTSITSTTSDGGLNYSVSATFQYKPDGWTATIAYRDDDGKIPSDADPTVEDKGFKKGIKLFEKKDFSSLGLPNG